MIYPYIQAQLSTLKLWVMIWCIIKIINITFNYLLQEDIVKLQILNLATKLLITNPKQTKLLSHYIFNLAKYDQNYDIRDRARLLRQLVQPSGDKCVLLAKHAKKIFLSAKPAPVLESRFKGIWFFFFFSCL